MLFLNVDQLLAIRLMESSFDGNPAVHFSIGNGRGYARRKKELALFMYRFCALRNGVYFSDDEQAIMLFYHSAMKVPFWKNFFIEARLVIKALGARRAVLTFLRKLKIDHHRRAVGPHLHCWYLGAAPEGRHYSSAAQLRDLLYAESDRQGIPVLAETTMLQNKNVYERMGFVVYASVEFSGMKTYLLRRDPKTRPH